MVDMLLGSGSHGRVYLNPGYDTVTKYIPLFQDHPRTKHKFLSIDVIIEPTVLLRLQTCHVPYIVNMKSYRIDRYTNVMGIKLETLDRMPLDMIVGNAKSLVAQVFTAVAAMHSIDVFHGDIKTDNVMLDPQTGEVRLIDFSLANMDPLHRCCNWQEVYTLNYRPPELLLGCKNFDRSKADVWAAGITCYEMLTGLKPALYGSKWYNIISEINVKFDNMQCYSEVPRWHDYIEYYFDSEIQPKRKTAREVLEKNRGTDAADFISHACDPNPQTRWSAKDLLEHPFIRDDPAIRKLFDVIKPEQVNIVKDPGKGHRLFVDQRNPDRELIVNELLNRLHIPPSDEYSYIGASHIVSEFLMESRELRCFSEQAIMTILERPQTIEFLSKWITTYPISNS